MNNSNKTYPLLIVILWAMLGCTADTQQVAQQKEVELRFSVATLGGAATRAADWGDTYNNALPSGSDIGVYIYGYEGSTGYDLSKYQPTVTETSTTWIYRTVGEAVTVDANSKESNLVLVSHDKAPKFPTRVTGDTTADMDNVQIFAVFPNNGAVTPSTESYTFTAELAQNTEANVKASDLMTSDITTYTKAQCDGASLRIDLKHRMVKVHVNFVPKSGSDLTTDNMPTTFEVQGVYRSLTVKPKTGEVTLNTAVAQTTAEAPLQAVTGHSFFIAPQTISSSSTWLKFDIRGSGNFKGIAGCTFKPTTDVTLTAGNSYEVTVTVDVDFASVTGTISAWNEETLSYDTVVL